MSEEVQEEGEAGRRAVANAETKAKPKARPRIRSCRAVAVLGCCAAVVVGGCAPVGGDAPTSAPQQASDSAQASADSADGWSGPDALTAGCEALPLPAGQAVPGFSGPYAPEFDAAYREASSEVARLVLADEYISEAELEEVKSGYVACLEGLGFLDVTVNNDGSQTLRVDVSLFPNAEEAQALEMGCGCSSGWLSVAPLFNVVRKNPDNADNYLLMAECLVRVGLRPEGYSAAQYRQEFEAGIFYSILEKGEGEDFEKLNACNDDPLHAK
jgi:hypothetical protein